MKPTPIIYLVFEKNDLFIYLIEQNVNIFIYCSFIFIYPLCCLQTKFTNKYYNFGFWAEYLSENMSIFKQGMSENWTIHITMMKNVISHILFLRKRGLIIYLTALKSGLFAPHRQIRTMSYIGSYPPPPPRGSIIHILKLILFLICF